MIPKPKKGKAADSRQKNRGGRPPVKDADRRDTVVRVLTTASEYETLQRAAAHVSMSVSTWMRSIAIERAHVLAAEIEAARVRAE